MKGMKSYRLCRILMRRARRVSDVSGRSVTDMIEAGLARELDQEEARQAARIAREGVNK